MKLFSLLIFSLTLLVCCKNNPPPESQENSLVESSEKLIKKIAEKDPDQLAINQVIQNYFDGWLTGDTTLVGSAMHSSCHLKFIRDGKLDIRNRTQYLSGFKPRPRLENAEGRIISIDITRTAAEAKIELETADRLFTDYFNLLKDGDRWYITDKVSTNIGKE